MQLNLGLFDFNGLSGYIVKPEYMRKKDRMFDPFAKTMDGVVASALTIRVNNSSRVDFDFSWSISKLNNLSFRHYTFW